ncbi:MAG: hypothetical protein IIX89_02620, partial [Oscillospiraceae bacterium]|nr:hypothetical protein [Oscillospiraceae bacterium]
MDFSSTVKGSLLEGFYPAGWDMEKIDACMQHSPEEVLDRQDFWNKDFNPVKCDSLADFDTYMGHEIAWQIKKARDAGEEIAFILPVGPMGMYKWAVYFLKMWNCKCDHVHCFNMDEWADSEGNTLSSDNPASFQYAMENALYNPLGELTVPVNQRNFATKENLPTYPEKIAALKAKGAKLVLVYGIGRMCHIAFWEPHFAADYNSVEEWKKQPYRIAAKIHPLTVEQNALTSFKSRTTLVPCRANTIGPGLFLQADYAIGGADGTLGRGMQWQGLSLW